MAKQPEQVDPGAAARRHTAIRADHMPRGFAFARLERRQERRGRRILERHQRDPSTVVEPRNDTRRESAEASAAVVEEHGQTRVHGLILPRLSP